MASLTLCLTSLASQWPWRMPDQDQESPYPAARPADRVRALHRPLGRQEVARPSMLTVIYKLMLFLRPSNLFYGAVLGIGITGLLVYLRLTARL